MSVRLLTYNEHANAIISAEDSHTFRRKQYQKSFTKKHRGNDASLPCFSIIKEKEESELYSIKTGYFIGLDWIDTNKSALYVALKLNHGAQEVDFIKMLIDYP